MKNAFYFAVWLSLCAGLHSEPFDHAYTNFARVLARHVQNGSVDYQALQKNRTDLDNFLRTVSAVDAATFKAWSREQRLAFLLNTYNAAVLQLVTDNYPVSSVKRIGGWFSNPFRVKFISLFGTKSSLDDIEHGMLRPDFGEPRIHFALVCAARSCPPLRREPYLPEKIDSQLNDQARLFLNDPSKNRIDADGRVVHLSAIFKWFREDFGTNEHAIVSFTARYWPEATRPALAKDPFKVHYLDYDWQLNDLKR